MNQTDPTGEIRPVPDVTEKLVKDLEARFGLDRADGFIYPLADLNAVNWHAGIAYVVNLLRCSLAEGEDTGEGPDAEEVLDRTYYAQTRRR